MLRPATGSLPGTSFLIGMVGLALPTGIRAGDPAGAALGHLEEAFGPAAVTNIVVITGTHAETPPLEWRFLIRDLQSDSFVHEFVVKDGLVFGPTRLALHPADPPSFRPVFHVPNVPVDSSRVFEICDRLAAAAGIGFDRLTYRLEWSAGDPYPTWQATLIDERRDLIVGHVFVPVVEDGTVFHQFFPAGETAPRNLRPVSGNPPVVTGQKPGTLAPAVPPVPHHRYGAREVP